MPIISRKIKNARKIPQSCKIFLTMLEYYLTKNGYCWLNNKLLSKKFSVSRRTITRWVGCLIDEKFIRCNYLKNSHRNIFILNRSSFDKKDKKTYYNSLSQEVANASNISSSTKLIYASILSLSENDRACCFASNKYLGILSGVSGRTVRRHLEKLKEHNLCQIHKVIKRKGNKFQYIRSIFPCTVKSSKAHIRLILSSPSKFFKKGDSPVNNIIGNIIGKLNL